MAKLTWFKDRNQYTTTCLDYIGTIVENEKLRSYDTRIESSDREIIESWSEFSDFLDAESWIMYKAIEHEQMSSPQASERMRQTFQLCRSIFSALHERTHIERLQYIEQWYFTRVTQDNELTEEFQQRLQNTKGRTPFVIAQEELLWQELSDQRFVTPTLHGRAVIQEIRKSPSPYAIASRITHRAYFEHANGARLEMGSLVTDFATAEAWIRQMTHQLDDPRVTEAFLDNIVYTLTICTRSFEQRALVFDQERVDYVKSLAEEILP